MANEMKTTQESIQQAMEYFAGPWEEFYATRMQGGAELTYIPWNKIVSIFNGAIAKGLIVSWDYYIQEIGTTKIAVGGRDSQQMLDACYVKVVLDVAITESFTITRQGVGTEAYAQAGYGDPISNATAMALRRAATLFGIGLELYDKENHDIPARQRPGASVERPAQVATPRQNLAPEPEKVGPTVEELDEAEAEAKQKSDKAFDLPIPSKTKFPPSEKQWRLLTGLMRKDGYTNENIDDLIYVLIEEGKINPQYVKTWENLSGGDVSKMIDYLKSMT